MKLVAGNGYEYTLEQSNMIIGRSPANHIVLNDSGVSNRHAALAAEGGSFILTDLNSTNGTFVNGAHLVAPHRLQPNDVIQMGGIRLVFQDDSGLSQPTMRMNMNADPMAQIVQYANPNAAYAPYAPPSPYMPAHVRANKNRITAGLFAILLGNFGVHHFYLGKVGLGVLYLLFFWSGIPGVIGIIEGIVYLTMNDADFAQKYG